MQMGTSSGSGQGEQLQAITDAALAHLELDVLLRTLVARICEILGIDSCTIAVHTADHDRVVSTGPQHDTVSTYVVPLELSGVLLGELRVAALVPHHFDAELLQLVADRAAMAIEHAQLFESERKARHRLECVQAVTDVALAHLELDELLQALLLRTRDTLGVDTCAALLLDPERDELVARAAVGIEEEVEQGVRIPVGGGFAGRIAANRRPVILPDVDHAHVLNPILHEKGIKSMMGVPLIVHDDVIGVIHVGTLKPHEFTRDDVELLQLVGERAALAIEKARVHQEMVRLDQMKLNFVAIASHELRTPATSVYGLLTTLRARGDELAPDVRAELEETAWYQSDRLRRLIEQLLDLSRLDARAIAVQPEPIVLERTLADLVTGDDVFVDVDPALAVVADPLVIERVVTNLIANARQHGRPPVHVSAEARDRHLRITVTDAGAGVPEQLVPRLFERFEHGGPNGGTGLGLAIAKAYANAHGGDLYYEPGPWGTRFDLLLPRS
ncbi:MAG TPA: GAF domain-containing protein [Gaiellaceae bacterium]|nr:GAF domain-containing protein [Gaiellaceae bacterium]